MYRIKSLYDNIKNMQNIPRENKYRNCFVAGEGNVFVASDYSGQELSIIADGSKDPVWLNAKEKGYDIHSVCAELVYGRAWMESAKDDCDYYKFVNGDYAKQKCHCKEHKVLRNNIKSINFGLAYGMSEYKLSNTLFISVEDARLLMEKYFKVFPNIKKFLDMLGRFATENGYIKTYSPVRRIRHFPEWNKRLSIMINRKMKLNSEDKEYYKLHGSIDRKGKNTPIQGSGADMIKIALCSLIKEVKKVSYPVKFSLQVHDEIICEVAEENAEDWKKIQERVMKEAGEIIIKTHSMDVESSINVKWNKD